MKDSRQELDELGSDERRNGRHETSDGVEKGRKEERKESRLVGEGFETSFGDVDSEGDEGLDDGDETRTEAATSERS